MSPFPRVGIITYNNDMGWGMSCVWCGVFGGSGQKNWFHFCFVSTPTKNVSHPLLPCCSKRTRREEREECCVTAMVEIFFFFFSFIFCFFLFFFFYLSFILFLLLFFLLFLFLLLLQCCFIVLSFLSWMELFNFWDLYPSL